MCEDQDKLNDVLAKLSEEDLSLLEKHFHCAVPTSCIRSRQQFTSEEDAQLRQLVKEYGENDWASIAARMKDRNARQCRERWRHYLSPSISKKKWTPEEDELLISKYNEYGPRWVFLTKFFNNRTDINLKNRWIVIIRREAKNKGKMPCDERSESNDNDKESLFDEFISCDTELMLAKNAHTVNSL